LHETESGHQDADFAVSRACLLLVACAIGSAAAFLVQGPMFGLAFLAWALLILALITLLGVLALVSICVCALKKSWRSSRMATLSRRAVLDLVLLACVCIGAVFLQGAITRFRIERAKEWLVARAPSIEQYKQAHGTYPPMLDGVVDLSAASWILRDGELRYSGDLHGYRFDLTTGFLSGWSWNSDTHRWEYYN
jgi:hypothetical protein